ncbi:hypothetical protein V6N11_060494 [Hibiscus sabdariffa]|uniref:Uncharacterized protein n=1 Tax=Hibiscus sabdariffa TaxID=183260 RepID=A0ABR2QQI6_9ROSI
MAKFNCFSSLTWKRKKDKGGDGSSNVGKKKEGIRTLQIKLEQLLRPFDVDELKSTTFTVPIPVGFRDDSIFNVKVVSQEREGPIRSEVAEVTYEAKDEHEAHASLKRDFSAVDRQYRAANDEEFDFKTKILASPDSFQVEKDVGKAVEMIESGYISDPGISRAEFRVSPKLRRLCLNLETRDVQRKVDKSFEGSHGLASSPASVITHCSADKHGGYSSDIVKLDQTMKISKMESPGSFTAESVNKDFSARNTAHLPHHSDIDLSEAVLHANNVIQTLNSSSTVAHISGTCLKAIPIITGFTGLRPVNLSNNFIGHITPGSLPKSLHTLNLSRNKISTIEGLQELTRLRFVDLSYNRIARIGHELYLIGNKISDLEGLHRLLKLTILDVSFNKITTTKALGQLVANYNSLQAMNLLGNPIQSNISNDQLHRTISSLLPKLTCLNKHPIKPQRGREVVSDSIAKAALGSGSWSSPRKTTNRGSHGGSTSPSMHKSSNKNKSKSRNRHHLSSMSPAHASSSR